MQIKVTQLVSEDPEAYTSLLVPESVTTVVTETLDECDICSFNSFTGSLQAWAHVCNLRCALDTQEETRVLAQSIDDVCKGLWPVSWKELRSGSC